MDNDLAISLDRVSKIYRLFDGPADRVKEALHPLRRVYHREHKALDGVSLNIKKGETIGIMGRNGAGKSTLLQVITGVLEPSSGRVGVSGRIAALLELGAGFNPEFTGRENLFANAPLTGLSRSEMEARLPAIREFANIGEYFDQPVRNYSSGMFLRLAFAMSVSVDPDILIIDEALAVGDARFQDKCFRRLREFREAGKTFVIVSHAASLIAELCDRVAVIEQGRVDFLGPPREALVHYGRLLFGSSAGPGGDPRALALAEGAAIGAAADVESGVIRAFMAAPADTDRCPSRPGYNPEEARSGDGGAQIVDFLIASATGSNDIAVGEAAEILVKFRYSRAVERPRLALSLHTPQGQLVYGVNTDMLGLKMPAGAAGEVAAYRLRFSNRLAAGDYLLSLWLAENGAVGASRLDVRESLAILQISGLARHNGLVDLDLMIDRLH